MTEAIEAISAVELNSLEAGTFSKCFEPGEV